MLSSTGVRIDQLNGLQWEATDIEKKFRHVYVYAGIKQTDGTLKKDVYYISGVAPTGIIVTTESGVAATEAVIPFSKFFILEDRPDPCISNVGDDSAFYFCWNPNRQWRRGACQDNSFVYHAPHIGQIPRNWTKEEANLIFKPVHYHLTDALRQFRENEKVQGRALNNRYWLTKKPAKDSPIQLYRQRCFLGSFIGKQFFISSDAEIFKDELQKELPVLMGYYA